jgi:Lrp/AsnC family transcriptional regulator
MDKVDIKILDLLQNNSDLTIKEISDAANVSTTPCWKRINKLKKQGIIKKTIAIIDQEKVQLNTTVFVFITIESHDKNKINMFSKSVKTLPEIVECHRLSGAVDYILKAIVKDIAAYDNFYKRLIGDLSFIKVTSSFVIESIKQTNALPIINQNYIK